MASNTFQTFSNHYLEVQALTAVEPASQAEIPKTATQPTSYSLSLTSAPVIIFITMLCIGAIGLLVTRAKELNKLLMVLAIAFITSILPLGMQLSSQKATIVSEASPRYVPREVIVSNVTSSSFTIQWRTDEAGVGVIRLRRTVEPGPDTRIMQEEAIDASGLHEITVSNLTPSTLYYFEILSGSHWYDNQGESLTVETLKR